MDSAKQSPINRTYLIGISTPQAVEQKVRRLVTTLERNGLISSPLPGFIPVAGSSVAPKAPVPGLLPVCREPLIPAEYLKIDSNSGWIYWPVDSGGWIDALSADPGLLNDEERTHGADIYPMRMGIALARSENNGDESILSSPEVSKILENPPGWRAINLVCWSVEYISGRPWYMSALWYPLWKRRLKRAPKLTNNNK